MENTTAVEPTASEEVDQVQEEVEIPEQVEIPLPEEEPEEKEIVEVAPLPQKVKRKRKPPTVIPSSDPNVEIEVRTRKKGPAKRRIVVYRDDLSPEPITIVEKSRKRGRPKKNAEVIVEQEAPAPRIAAPPSRQPTLRELKKQELDLRFEELQQAAGRPLRQTKRGKVDKRCVAERTEAQIASAKALVERNRARAADRRKSDTQDAVKEVISTLSARKPKKEKAAEAPPPPPPPPPPRMPDPRSKDYWD